MNVGSSKLPFLKLRLFKLPVYSNSRHVRHGSPYTPGSRSRIQVYLLRVRGSKRHFGAFLLYVCVNCKHIMVCIMLYTLLLYINSKLFAYWYCVVNNNNRYVGIE